MLGHQHLCYNASGLTGCISTPPVLTATFLCERTAMAEAIITQAQAKAEGLKFYFTGKPCKHGHVAKRYTSGGACEPCVVAAHAAYRAANLETLK